MKELYMLMFIVLEIKNDKPKIYYLLIWLNFKKWTVIFKSEQ